MFLKRKMNDSTNSYSDKILQIKEKIGEADAVVIGAGAGFSTSAGFVYDGERFEKYFLDFRKKYGFSDMYAGGFFAFCTKKPAPMLPYMNVLKPYGQYWFVTITPYGRDIEPNVPDKEKVMDDFKKLSDIVGVDSMGWRYDPIFID